MLSSSTNAIMLSGALSCPASVLDTKAVSVSVGLAKVTVAQSYTMGSIIGTLNQPIASNPTSKHKLLNCCLKGLTHCLSSVSGNMDVKKLWWGVNTIFK
jgi:hypothetical protein